MSLFNAAVSSSQGIYIPNYNSLTEEQLSKILRSSSSNQEGSSVTKTAQANGNPQPLFAIDNNRFIHFLLDSSGYPSVVVANVTSGTPSLSSVTNLRSSSASFRSIKQNPANPRQFAILDSQGYTYLVTVDSTGTGITTSSHNTAGSISGLSNSQSGCAIVWSTDGVTFVACTKDASDWKLVLFTCSGTTLTYVGNTASSGLLISGVGYGAAASLTGNVDNEFVFTAMNYSGGTARAQIIRATFTQSAVTIAAQTSATPSPGVGTPVNGGSVVTAGSVHVYAVGTSPSFTQRAIMDGSGSGTCKGLSWDNGTVKGDMAEYHSAAQLGNYSGNMTSILDGNSVYIAMSGFGFGLIGPNVLYTKGGSEDALGLCLSHDYSKILLITVNSTTYTYSGFSTPTT